MALLFSGPQESRIKERAQALGDCICGEAVQPLSSIACTLATRREHHDFRTAVVAESLDGASDSVNLLRDNKKSVDIISGRTVETHCANGAVWVFSDFRAQWQGMGKELVAKEIVFQDAIAELDVVILSELGFSARKVLEEGDFDDDSAERILLLIPLVQIGFAAVLRSRGVRPGAIIGHSVGEVSAAVAASALTPKEGAIVLCKRAILIREVMGKRAMLMVNAPYQQVEESSEPRPR
jgi:6-methylsalicylic acid synthase